MPRALAEEPEVADHLGFVWAAFWELSDDRPLSLGYGVAISGAIPFVSIDRYAARFGLVDPDDFDRFAGLIRDMDAEWRAEAHKAGR